MNRTNTIRWLAGIAGQLQKRLAEVERENARLRTENRDLRKQQNHVKAMAAAAK